LEERDKEQLIAEMPSAFDYETLKAYHLLKRRGAIWYIAILFSLVAVGCIFAFFYFERDIFWLGFGGFFLLMGAVYCLAVIGTPLMKDKKNLQKAQAEKFRNSFRFYSDRIEFEGSSVHSHGAATQNYRSFTAASEGPMFFTLEQNGFVYLFAKKDIEAIEQIEALHALLQEKFGKKFKEMR